MLVSAQWKAKLVKKWGSDVSKGYSSGSNKADEHPNKAGMSAFLHLSHWQKVPPSPEGVFLASRHAIVSECV